MKSKYIGKQFGNLTVIGSENRKFICKCKCNNIVKKDRSSVIRGDVIYCNRDCLLKPTSKKSSPKNQYIGQTFGTLLIIDLEKVNNEYYFKCKCKCGNIVVKHPRSILSELSITCGFKCPFYIQNKRENQININNSWIGKIIDGYKIIGLDFILIDGINKSHFVFKCECGNEFVKLATMVKNGKLRPICDNPKCSKSFCINTQLGLENNSSYIGKQFGNLLVTKLIFDDTIEYPFNFKFKCTCLTCGNTEFIIDCKRFRAFKPFQCNKCNTNSNQELFLQKFFDDNFIDYKFNILIDSKMNIQNKVEVDFLINDQLGIELHGLQTHATLLKEKNNYFITNKPKFYHLNKTLSCQDQNIELLQFWNVELINKPDIVKSIILNKINKSYYKTYARKCAVKEIDKQTYDEFMNKHHIQGTTKGESIRIGLFYKYNNNLVSVMSFGFSRYDRYEWEMFRFASFIHCNIVGAASKLFKYFVRKCDPTSIVSYSDRRIFNNGKLYEILGFKFSHNSDPGYWYFLSSKNDMYNKLQHRSVFMKHKLKDKLQHFDPNLTEWENMEVNGYLKIYDCGNKVYYWEK